MYFMFGPIEKNDKELIRQLRLPRPDSDFAFLDIYLKYSNRLNAYCMMKIFDKKHTQDLIQDIWLEFVKSVNEGKEISIIQSYLMGIASNKVYDYLKEQKRTNHIYVNNDGIHLDGFSINYNLQESLENADLLAIVKLVASSLDEPEREIYLLKKFNELTFVEISQITGESIQSIKRIFSKASIMMEKLLKPYFEEMKGK
ncbi:MAG: sigma-70 family RNA polymerase sigma factor [Ignavibacteriae bacterium]|nr:sigma-70 family RNA polymerase sigma factor [Ignavibacteriota bacterium]